MRSAWRGSPDDHVSRLLVERAHDELVAGHEDDPRLAQVRPLVRESWRRSVGSSVGVESLPVLELDAATLELYRRDHPLASSMPLIRSLLLPADATDAGVIVAVGDAAGRLLWIEGDHGVRSMTADMGFVEGANWSEDRVGTTAPGTALALGGPVQVRGPEHFNRLVQPWSCTAVPVRDPEYGTVIGMIDVTGGEEAASAQAQMLVTATVRAVENQLMVTRLTSRQEGRRRVPASTRQSAPRALQATLQVLGRDRSTLAPGGVPEGQGVELGLRHAEILLLLLAHPQGVRAERLAELVYGSASAVRTLRPEMVRLRKLLEAMVPPLVIESRPYRLATPVETDAHRVLSLLDRGAHRIALASYRGDVLPGSAAPGVEELRESVRTALRIAVLRDGSREVLVDYLETDVGADDVEAMEQLLALLPAGSPRRAGIEARLRSL